MVTSKWMIRLKRQDYFVSALNQQYAKQPIQWHKVIIITTVLIIKIMVNS